MDPPEKKGSNSQEKYLQANGNITLTTNTSTAREPKVSDQLNETVPINSHDLITPLSCPKEAEEGTCDVEERSATYHSFICPEDKAEQSAAESEAPVYFTSKERTLTLNSSPHVLLDTKIRKTYDLIQYWQHYMTGHSFKYSCFNVSISNIIHLFFPMSFQKGTETEGALFDLRIKAKPPDWRIIQNILQKLTQGTIRRIGECTSRNPKLDHVQDRTLTCFFQFKENPPDICLQIPRLWTYGTYLDSQKRMKPNLLSLGTGQAILRTRSVQIMECDAVTKPILYWKQDYENITTIRQQGWAKEILIRARDTEFEPEQIIFFVLKEHNKSDYADITLWSLSKEPTAGIKTTLKRTRRIQKWEDDQRFKPPDLDQNKRQNLGFFFLIKEEPPDATPKPKPRLLLVGGNFLTLHDSVSTNLFYVHADKSDLRTNPFQLGEDDMNLDSPKIMELVADMYLSINHGKNEAEEMLLLPDGPLTKIKRWISPTTIFDPGITRQIQQMGK